MERLPDQLAGQPLAAAEGREGADDGRGSTSTSTPDGRRLALARRADEAPAPTTTDGRRARVSIPHDERRSHVQFRDDRGDRRGLLGTRLISKHARLGSTVETWPAVRSSAAARPARSAILPSGSPGTCSRTAPRLACGQSTPDIRLIAP